MELFVEGHLNAKQVYQNLIGVRCVSPMSSSGRHGILVSACKNDVFYCKDCNQYYVLKFSKHARKGLKVFLTEAKVLQQISIAMKTLKQEFKLYASFVLQFVNYFENSVDNDIILVTKLVHTGLTLKDYIQECTFQELCVFIIQIFMTLEVISKCVPGFLHLDLLTSQIFLRPTKADEHLFRLRIDENSVFVLPIGRFIPVIGDFGFSVSNMYWHRMPFGPEKEFYCKLQDIYRLLSDIYFVGNYKFPKLYGLLQEIFDGHFDWYLQQAQDYYNHYLPPKACKSKLLNYIDVMSYSPTLLKFCK